MMSDNSKNYFWHRCEGSETLTVAAKRARKTTNNRLFEH